MSSIFILDSTNHEKWKLEFLILSPVIALASVQAKSFTCSYNESMLLTSTKGLTGEVKE